MGKQFLTSIDDENIHSSKKPKDPVKEVPKELKERASDLVSDVFDAEPNDDIPVEESS